VPSLYHHAVALAATGKFSSLSEIRRALAAQGFSLAELEELQGAAIRKELRVMIAASQADASATVQDGRRT